MVGKAELVLCATHEVLPVAMNNTQEESGRTLREKRFHHCDQKFLKEWPPRRTMHPFRVKTKCTNCGARRSCEDKLKTKKESSKPCLRRTKNESTDKALAMHSPTIAPQCLRDQDLPQATKQPLPVINASPIARCVTAAMQAEMDLQALCRSPAPAVLEEATIAILSLMKPARTQSPVVTHTVDKDKVWLLLQDHRCLRWITTLALDRDLLDKAVPPPCERRSDRRAPSATSTCAMQATGLSRVLKTTTLGFLSVQCAPLPMNTLANSGWTTILSRSV